MANLKISALDFVREAKLGNISVEDFVARTIEQIQSVDGTLHAFLSLNDSAVAQAREIDKKSDQDIKSARALACLYPSRTTCA